MMRRALLPLFPLCLLPAAACSSSSSADAGPQPVLIGDQSKPIEMMIVHRTVDGGVEVTMDTIPLIQPPQGGKVVFVGVRARNLDGRGVIITASIRDTCDSSVLALEDKPIDLEPTSDGWGEPKQPVEISNYSNLPACPNAGAQRNVQSETYELKVKIQDRNGKKAEQTIMVTPYCAEPNLFNQCLCECQHGAALGTPCPANFDAGMSHIGCTMGAKDGG